MITDADIKKMKKVFVTKGDLVGMEKRQDKKFSSINTQLRKIKTSLELAIDVFDRHVIYHHKRLVNLEKKTGLEEQPYSPTAN